MAAQSDHEKAMEVKFLGYEVVVSSATAFLVAAFPLAVDEAHQFGRALSAVLSQELLGIRAMFAQQTAMRSQYSQQGPDALVSLTTERDTLQSRLDSLEASFEDLPELIGDAQKTILDLTFAQPLRDQIAGIERQLSSVQSQLEKQQPEAS